MLESMWMVIYLPPLLHTTPLEICVRRDSHPCACMPMQFPRATLFRWYGQSRATLLVHATVMVAARIRPR